ncbi:phage tail tape measure protein [Sphingobacterium kitahiroshimense]|uniref:phage tail tape measure protein n=1 Tax=Sphingobacterium sp. B16(2022) TaxID=2914044 RepID=UPI00143AB13D|nr:phage tail tape measure protein [Sphingobacterium sp. B16(2022)]NJI75826.1 phage tail tape measure protein [Sphingobacterium sp. B16(2022)]
MAKKLTEEDLVLNIIVNGNKAQSDIGKLSRSLVDAKANLKATQAEMKELEKQGQKNSSRYLALAVEADKYNATILETKRKLSELNQSLKLNDQNEKQLEATLKRMIALRKQSVPGSENYKAYSQQIDMVRNRLRELGHGADQTGNSILRTANRLNQYIGAIVAGGASMIALWAGAKRASDEYAHFDDVLADVMKTTNLTKTSIKDLNAELTKIETRTSQEDMLGLARIAGKLGYTDIKDITEFVRANNQIIVSLNEDLGGNVEETVNKIGKLVDIFKLKDLYTTEEAFLKVGSSINELGMASTANEGYMVEFARRMAGVAPLAGITIDQILGLGATLDQLGQSEEVSSTSLSKMFLAMAKNAETYSKYAGMKLNDFKGFMEKDFMGAFVKVLEGVKNNSAGINELAGTLGDLGEDGGRTIGVLGSLANNVDVLRSSMNLASTSMKDGTSITAEYAIKNETAAAKMEMAQKRVKALWIELGEKLNPVVLSGTNLVITFFKVLMTLFSFLANNHRIIIVITASIIAYNATIAISNINLTTNIALTKLKVLWEKLLTAGTILLIAAQELLAGRILSANRAMALFFTTIGLNPIALLVAGIGALVAAFVVYGDNLRGIVKVQDSLNNAMRKASEDTAAQLSEIDSLNKVMTDNKVAHDKRIAAMDQLKQIMPGVLDGYTKEELLLGKATTAINTYSEALVLNSQIQAKRNELNNLAEKELKVQKNDLGFLTDTYRYVRQSIIGVGAATVENAMDNVESLQNINKARKELTDSILSDQQKLNKIVVAKTPKAEGGTKVGIDTSKEDAKAARAAEAASKKARLKELEDAKKDYQDKLKAEGLFQRDINSLTADELEKRAQIKDDYIKKENEINQKYNHSQREQTNEYSSELDRRAATERRYRDKLVDKTDPLIQQEKEDFEKRLQLAGLFDKEMEDKVKKWETLTVEQQTALEILRNNHQKNLNKIDADAIEKRTDKLLKSNSVELSELRIKHNEELSEITTLAQAKETLSSVLNAKELSSIKTLGDARRLIRNQQDLEEQKLQKQHLESLLLVLNATIESGQMEGMNLSDSILSDKEKESLQTKIREIKEELSKLKGLDKTDDIKDDQRSKVDILGMATEDWEKLFENIGTSEEKLNRVFGALGAMTQVWSAYNNMVASGENAQLQKDEQVNKKKRSNLDSRLKSGTISQESYNKQVEKLDKDLDKKKSEVAHKQAKRERNVSLMSAVVNTASAVTKALPNIFLAALVGAMGALQIGTILKTPLPAIEGREDGGYIDVTRSQDGKQFRAKNDPKKRGFVPQTSVIVSEEGTEWVANADLVRNPFAAPIISLLDTMQSNGRIDPAVLSNIITSTMPGRANGGYLNNNSSRSSTATPGQTTIVNESDEEIRKLIANNTAVTNALYQAVKNGVSVSLLGPEGFKAKMAELDRIQNNADL